MLLGLIVALAVNSQTSKPEAALASLGGFHRKVATESPQAQRFFDQGLLCLYAFHYGQARRSFQVAVTLDPKCAMNYWGIAYSYGPFINAPDVDPAQSKRALDALNQADAAPEAFPLERQIIGAQRVRFSTDGPADRTKLNQAYAGQMGALWKAHPNDPDVGALYAEALIDERPWNQWTLDGKANPGTLEAISVLESVLRMNSKHPMGLHMYIHALEASPQPERALRAADTLFNLVPELGHLQHMPCHIYARLGRWERSITANLDAIAKVDKYMASRGIDPNRGPRVDHYGEALAFAAGMRGMSQLALDAVTLKGTPLKDLEADYADADGDLAMPLEIEQQFGKWDQILSTPSFGAKLPISETMRLGARCVAYAATGHLAEAKTERDRFGQSLSKIPASKSDGLNLVHDILAVEHHLMEGEILIREAGHEDDGLAELRRAVECEDALHYSEPPEWLMPTRHSLGAALLLLGRYREAEPVFRENLRRTPNDGWATLGLAKSYAGEGKNREAALYQSKFKKLWKDADISINTSCLCLETSAKAKD